MHVHILSTLGIVCAEPYGGFKNFPLRFMMGIPHLNVGVKELAWLEDVNVEDGRFMVHMRLCDEYL